MSFAPTIKRFFGVHTRTFENCAKNHRKQKSIILVLNSEACATASSSPMSFTRHATVTFLHCAGATVWLRSLALESTPCSRSIQASAVTQHNQPAALAAHPPRPLATNIWTPALCQSINFPLAAVLSVFATGLKQSRALCRLTCLYLGTNPGVLAPLRMRLAMTQTNRCPTGRAFPAWEQQRYFLVLIRIACSYHSLQTSNCRNCQMSLL
jgi:hypothetical protein